MTDSDSRAIVVMGVSGSGKSTIGIGLAERLSVPFVDADDLHPLTNVDKMAAGLPLTDDDRWPWLHRVGQVIAEHAETGVVVACSALKRAYRDAIRGQAPRTRFVELFGTRELLASRLGAREGHFMPAALLDSQLDTLESLQSDEAGVRVDVAPSPDEIVAEAARLLGA